MTRKICILGTGGTSIDILDTLSDINSQKCADIYECIGFLDDNPSLWGKTVGGVNVIGGLALAQTLCDCFFVNGIGSPTNFWQRESIISSTAVPAEKFEPIVHPSSSISRSAVIGRGTVVFQNVTITSNATIGNHVVILPNSVISHDDTVGDYTSITAGVSVSGGVRIGRSCYLGTNSSIMGNINIGDRCMIGMGSVVLNDVPPNSVFVGNPAKCLRRTVEQETSA